MTSRADVQRLRDLARLRRVRDRIERAMALLRRGDLSVTEVCFAVGCSSLRPIRNQEAPTPSRT